MPRPDLSSPVPLPPHPRSWWRAVRPEPRYAPLAADADCDVVVVGAGVVGLTTALLLAREGVSVRVLESRDVGSGCTGHSSAKVSVVHGTKVASLRSTHSRAVAQAYVDANTAGARLLREEAEGIDGGALEVRAATVWTEEDDEASSLRSEAAALRDAGVDARDLDAPAVRDLGLPGPVVAGFRVEGEAQVDPVGYLRGLAAQVDAAEGCAVHERSRVTEVDDVTGGRRRPRVHTAGGTVAADHVVLATQVPSLDRGLWFARLEPHRSHQLTVRTEATPPEDMMLREGGATRSLRTAPDPDDPSARVLLVGGDGHKTGQGGDTRAHPAALARFADERFGLREVVAQWAAQDYTPLDSLPSVGPVWPLRSRVLVATGFAKWGMSNGGAAALVLRDRVLGRESPWADLYAPRPHAPGTAARTAVRANADVGRAMVTGWAGAMLRGRSRPAEGEGHVERHGARPVGACQVDGVVSRVSGVCPHLGGVLAWNAAERSWDCPLHGSRFSADGALLQGPATDDLSHVD